MSAERNLKIIFSIWLMCWSVIGRGPTRLMNISSSVTRTLTNSQLETAKRKAFETEIREFAEKETGCRITKSYTSVPFLCSKR